MKALISHESINIIYTQIGFTKRYCATLMQSENCTWIGIQQPANISKTSKCICIFQVVQSLSIHSFLVFLPLPRLAQTVRVYVLNLQFPEWVKKFPKFHTCQTSTIKFLPKSEQPTFHKWDKVLKPRWQK
jgi:hypothetical protein